MIKTEFGLIFGGYSPCHQLNENNLNKEGAVGGVIFQSVGDQIVTYPCLKSTLGLYTEDVFFLGYK